MASSSARLGRRLPCDQCHRRKVKCDGDTPCVKCLASELQCTREIVRKRRGPKKGSGSVIAQLRHENTGSRSPTGDYPDEDGAIPYSSSPNDSPDIARGPPQVYLPSPLEARNPMFNNMPQQSPTSSRPSTGVSPSSTTSPMPWQLDYGTPPSPHQPGSDHFITVNELARRIFYTDDRSSNLTPAGPTSAPSSATTRPPTSIAALLSTSPTTNSILHPLTQSSSTSSAPHTPLSRPPSSRGLPSDHFAVSLSIRGNAQSPTQIHALAAAVDLPHDIIFQCINLWFGYIYPIMPVIHEASFRRLISRDAPLREDEKCLIMAMCALACLSTTTEFELEARKELGEAFVKKFIELRSNFDYIETATLNTIIANVFMQTSYFELKKPRSAYIYLREATGLCQELGFYEEKTYKGMAHVQSICHRRAVALLFVTERGLSILRNKPITMHELTFLPEEFFDDEDPSVMIGFQCISRLFSLLDKNFVHIWNSPPVAGHAHKTASAPEELVRVQHNLKALSFETSGLSDIQKADVMITQQWLRLVFWQAAMRQGFVSSTSGEQSLSYDYPVDIAKSLCSELSRLPVHAVIVHGLGIVSGRSSPRSVLC